MASEGNAGDGRSDSGIVRQRESDCHGAIRERLAWGDSLQPMWRTGLLLMKKILLILGLVPSCVGGV
jgi:hypothetical protein